jgi:hypothetical protein
MTLDEHAKHLGGLLANFQSLEFIIRSFLQELPTARQFGIPYGEDIYSFPVGTEIPENEITSYDSLGILIKKFNTSVKQKGLTEIDTSLVEIRDALAHGRISAPEIGEQLRLIKFSKPQNGKVQITFSEAMTEDWFKFNKKRVRDSIQIVQECLRS